MNGVYTIYSYYNQTEIQAILNAIVGMLGAGGVNGDYLSLVRMAAMLGIFVSTAWGFARARGEDAAQYVVIVALFYSTLLVPRVTVWIEDHAVGHQAPVSVDNVPLGLAFFASTTSHIGFWLTETMETFFALPSTSLKISESGLMGGSRTLRMAQSATIRDPVLAHDMAMFMRDCVNPELTLQPSAIAKLQTSKNLWTEITTPVGWLVNPGRMVVLHSSGGAPVDCQTAVTQLDARLTAETTQQTSKVGQMLFPHLSTASANTFLGSLLPGAESLMMTASASAQDAIKQRLMINLMSDTSMTMGQMMNDPAAIQRATGLAMATEAANSSYGVMAKMAQETLPIVRNAFELVTLGVFPIIVLLVIIAGPKGGALLRSYVMTMMWVQLWAPLYAIVNYVATMHAARQMKASLQGIDGIALVNAADVVNTSISADAVAGILSVLVPMIALAIVKGGEVAAAGLASGMMAPAQSAAGSAGSAVGTGNIQFGNTSWSNHTANNTREHQHQGAFNYAEKSGGHIDTPYGGFDIRPGENGQRYGNFQAKISNPGGNVTGGVGTSKDYTADSGRGVRGQTESGAGLDHGTRGSMQHMTRSEASAVAKVIADQVFGGGTDASETKAIASAKTNAHAVRNDASTETVESLTLGGRLGAEASARLNAGNPAHTAADQAATRTASGHLEGGQPAAQGGQPQKGAAAAPTDPRKEKFQNNLVNALMNLPLSGMSAGLAAGLGLNTATAEGKKWSSAKTGSTEARDTAENRLQALQSAFQRQQASIGDTGQRTAAKALAGALEESWNATKSGRTTLAEGEDAGQRTKLSDSANATGTVNLNEQMAGVILAGNGNNPYAATKAMATDAEGRRSAMQKVTSDEANGVVMNPSAAGGTGKPIGNPASMEDTKAKWASRVAEADQQNQRVAKDKGHGFQAQALSEGASTLGTPPDPSAFPSIDGAAAAYARYSEETARGMSAAKKGQQVDAGIEKMAGGLFEQASGLGRMLDMTTGGLFGRARTHEQNTAYLRNLADNDKDARNLLQVVGNREPTEADYEYLARRAEAAGIKP